MPGRLTDGALHLTHLAEDPMNMIDLDAARRISQDRIEQLSSDARSIRADRARRRAQRRRGVPGGLSPTLPPAS
jgi:hypothetical protein